MIDIDRRALYTALRLNWQLNPGLQVEDWQVADYRAIPSESLYLALQERGVGVDANTFAVFAEAADTPEELTEIFLTDFDGDHATQDQVYLLVFELWRRYLPEKQCLSIFCDELDQQMIAYDRGELVNVEHIEDTLNQLKLILDENVDQGLKPKEAIDSLSSGCANNLPSFLYDFVTDQFDNGNYSYGKELLDAFYLFLSDSKWFALLNARANMLEEEDTGNELMEEVVRRSFKDPDAEYNLEILASMEHVGDCVLFAKVAKKTIPLLESEEEFHDFLSSCIEFFRCRDRDDEQQKLQDILDSRSVIDLDMSVTADDEAFSRVKKIFQ